VRTVVALSPTPLAALRYWNVARQRYTRRLARNGKSCASLAIQPPSQPRTPARKAGVLDARKRLRERDGLSAGGRWIRTLGPPSEGQRFSRRSRPISGGGDSRAEPCRDGFIARPDVPALLREAHKHGYAIDLANVTYDVGHETVVPADDEKALPRRVEALVAFMQRNSALDRLFQAADWCGRRNRLGNIDLSRDQSR
jgi:hypothetical protein